MKFRLPSVVSQAGFTMIELLVVIAVIGVLAVAVLSSINPIEQINKGRDTRSRSDAAQLINALDRYFSIHEVYPWDIESIGGLLGDYTPVPSDRVYSDSFVFNEADETLPSAWAWLDPLVDTAEVKSSFVQRIAKPGTGANALPDYYINKPNTTNATVYVCFKPSSNAFQDEANKRCDTDTAFTDEMADAGGMGVVCPTGCETNTSDAIVCYICLP